MTREPADPGAGEPRAAPPLPAAPDTHQKAAQVNLDGQKYGTFAEIGAGQEVARWFFRVGGAAGTVAKTISAYDMRVSDAIYGSSKRYVSRERLTTMLKYEYELLLERLDAERGAGTTFFVFADTVAARSYSHPLDSNGWLGIRFQAAPRAAPSEIIAHVLMLDRENLQQQEALGILGVNLVHAALFHHGDPHSVIGSLLDGLSSKRVAVDMFKFSGPAFEGVDNRLMSLLLVQHGMAEAAMFSAGGEVVQASEVLYKQAVLVERGRFRPVTKVTHDMLSYALAQFRDGASAGDPAPVVLMEMTLQDLAHGEDIDHQDFLARVDLLGALGWMVLISGYFEYYKLASYLSRHTRGRIGIVMGVPSLLDLLDEQYYADLDGGLLESIGRLFKSDLKLFVYPMRKPEDGSVITAETVEVPMKLRHLYAHLRENGYVVPIRDSKEEDLRITTDEVLELIQLGRPGWEDMVPAEVAGVIRERKLFGYPGAIEGGPARGG